MDVEVFGHAGARVIAFPTTMGTHREWPDRHMHEVLADHLEQGWIQLFCIGQIHDDSWYGKHLHPGHRAWMHLRYVEDEGADHNESWWGPRLRAALPFLLGS